MISVVLSYITIYAHFFFIHFLLLLLFALWNFKSRLRQKLNKRRKIKKHGFCPWISFFLPIRKHLKRLDPKVHYTLKMSSIIVWYQFRYISMYSVWPNFVVLSFEIIDVNTQFWGHTRRRQSIGTHNIYLIFYYTMGPIKSVTVL